MVFLLNNWILILRYPKWDAFFSLLKVNLPAKGWILAFIGSSCLLDGLEEEFSLETLKNNHIIEYSKLKNYLGCANIKKIKKEWLQNVKRDNDCSRYITIEYSNIKLNNIST